MQYISVLRDELIEVMDVTVNRQLKERMFSVKNKKYPSGHI
jgi:hypothetical protein